MLDTVNSDIDRNAVRAAPHNIEAEQSLLGSLLTNNNMLDRIIDRLAGGHFYDPLHGRIFDTIRQRIQSGMGVSAVTLKSVFADDEAMQELGGAPYLIQLTEAAVSVGNAHDYANTVYELALRRMLIQLGEKIRDEAQNGASLANATEQIEQAERELYQLGERGHVEQGHRSFGEMLPEVIRNIEHARKNPGSRGGRSTGLTELDKVIGGLRNSDLVIIAGRTGMGKSALGANIANAVAIDVAEKAAQEQHGLTEQEERASNKKPGVLYFSLEMSADQLITRLLASQTRIPTWKVGQGKISEDEFQTFIREANNVVDLPLYIDESASLKIGTLCARARRMHRQTGVAAIFVDYLQLVESELRGEGRVQQVSEISRRLKGLAKELNRPVVALAQLSRQVETRESKLPQLSDLRESGSIEQDADIVILLHRDEYYHDRQKPNDTNSEEYRKWEEKAEEITGVANLNIAKHRNGPTSMVNLNFDGTFMVFQDRIQNRQPQPEYDEEGSVF